jgi:raffinose synthase
LVLPCPGHGSALLHQRIITLALHAADWDMFSSRHVAAEIHAAARAVSGGPVYVSDAPGSHAFDLLRRLVLPDGTVLRARLPGRPTRDTLFRDVLRDGASLLKVRPRVAAGISKPD